MKRRNLDALGFWIAMIAGVAMFGMGEQSWIDRGLFCLIMAVIFKMHSQEEDNGRRR